MIEGNYTINAADWTGEIHKIKATNKGFMFKGNKVVIDAIEDEQSEGLRELLGHCVLVRWHWYGYEGDTVYCHPSQVVQEICTKIGNQY